jgi:hypothetical protein
MATNGTYYSNSTGLNLTSGGSVRLNIATGGGITFNGDYTFPTSDGGTKEVLMTDGVGNVDFNTIPNASLDNSGISVTSGVGIDASATVDLGGNLSITIDLSELTTTTTAGDADFFTVVNAANNQFKIASGNINISTFNNDAGYITSASNTNIYNTNGSLAANRIITQGGNNLDIRETSATASNLNIYSASNTTINTPRVRIEGDGSYNTVLELKIDTKSVSLVEGYNQGGALVFSVDGSGNLTANSKSFLIPHPSKDGFNLRHGSLEGPEHGVYVRGKVDGTNTIELPEYWLDLVDEDTITVQLTPIGSHQNLYVKDVLNNTIVIGNSNILSAKIKCFYLVQAERKDIDKMLVEYPQGDSSL